MWFACAAGRSAALVRIQRRPCACGRTSAAGLRRSRDDRRDDPTRATATLSGARDVTRQEWLPTAWSYVATRGGAPFRDERPTGAKPLRRHTYGARWCVGEVREVRMELASELRNQRGCCQLGLIARTDHCRSRKASRGVEPKTRYAKAQHRKKCRHEGRAAHQQHEQPHDPTSTNRRALRKGANAITPGVHREHSHP